jgi:hypothetical protein
MHAAVGRAVAAEQVTIEGRRIAAGDGRDGHREKTAPAKVSCPHPYSREG